MEVPVPVPGPGELRIRVAAAGVNRPDALQRQGLYDPPPGASPLPGLEVAGTVDELGPGTERFAVGDRVCALMGGGGYAEYGVAPEGHCLPVPSSVSDVLAAAVPETWFTVWANVFELGRLAAGERLLVHGGSSGIGHTAIQLAKAFGAEVITTSSSDPKCDFCRSMGADLAINYRTHDFAEACQAFTDGGGVDVVLDMVGGEYLKRNVKVLAPGGRHVSIAFLRGATAPVNIAQVMAKQAVLTGSFLRRRSRSDKERLARAVEENLWPLLSSGRARPHVDQSFPLVEASEAHRVLESGDFFGKIVLQTELASTRCPAG